MNRIELFESAVVDYDGSLKGLRTQFGVIENIIRSIDNEKISEDQKRIRLGQILETIKRKDSRDRVQGVKVIDLTNIINSVFAVNSGVIGNSNISKLPLKDISYYFSVMIRLAQSDIDLRTSIIEGRKEAMRLQNLEKEKALEEQRKKEEALLAQMSEVDKEIFRLQQEENDNFSNELYAKIDSYEGEDKTKIAKAIKEYWLSMDGKWPGSGKLSKKQKEKVSKIKKILGE